jgi:cytochrome c-type biogenesis protein CcmE
MNKASKKRLMVAGLVIVVVAAVLFAVLGSGGVATSLTVAQAASGDYDGKKVQVSGAVVQDSYTSSGASAVFSIADDDGAQLEVVYSGAMPATFGNGVTAICTGVVTGSTMTCNEMVTKCPSKYESAEGSLTVASIVANPAAYVGADVKLAGYVVEGSIAGIDADERFSVTSQGSTLAVSYDGALPDGLEDGSAVIVSGALDEGGALFVATDVALDASVSSQS